MAKHTGKWVSYLRVSTDKQGDSGLGIEAQRAAVLAYLNGGSWTLAKEFIEVESGKRDDNRPELKAALARCRQTGATLVIAKLDRLARNVAFIANLMESGVPFVCCDMPHASEFEMHIRASLAEEEARMISRRTKAALAAAKARGVVLGGYRGVPPDHKAGTAKRQAKAKGHAAEITPTIRAMQAEGLSLNRIAARLTEMAEETPRGGTAWTATAVKRVIAREAAAA